MSSTAALLHVKYALCRHGSSDIGFDTYQLFLSGGAATPTMLCL